MPRRHKNWLFKASVERSWRGVEPLASASGPSAHVTTTPPIPHWTHWILSPLKFGRSGAWDSYV